jgi:Haem-binding domain
VAPGSWLVEHDVDDGRNHLNMSQWQRYNLETQIDLLASIASEVRSGQMPVKQYLILHPKARLSPEEQATDL